MKRLPRSIPEWGKLILACGVPDDTVETHWLERKGPLKLATAAHKFAVAKAILAFANRDPDSASPFLDGHALVIVGIEKTGQITGVPRIEDHQLQAALKPYLGDDDDSPRWLVSHRHQVDAANDVIVFDIAPPEPGDPIHTLRQEFDSFRPGTVFARLSTESAQATPAAMRMLQRRLLARQANGFAVDLTLNSDAISAYTYDPTFIEPLLNKAAEEHLRALKKPSTPDPKPLLKKYGLLSGIIGPRVEEDRTEAQFGEQIVQWMDNIRHQIPELAQHIVAYRQPAVHFTVANTCGLFLEDLEIEIHIEGNVTHLPKPEDSEVTACLPQRPRPWGPYNAPSPLAHLGEVNALSSAIEAGIRSRRPNSTHFENSGSVDATLTCDELRPSRSHTFTTDDNHTDIVLLTTDPTLTSAHLTFTATAHGIHGTHQGERTLPVTQLGDITHLLQGFLDSLNYLRLPSAKKSNKSDD